MIGTPADEVVIRRLMEVANDAMGEEAEILDASGSEVMSAIFTLTLTSITAALSLGAEPAALRKSVERLLDACGPRTGQTLH